MDLLLIAGRFAELLHRFGDRRVQVGALLRQPGDLNVVLQMIPVGSRFDE